MINPLIFEELMPIDFLDIKKGKYLISNLGRVFSNNINKFLSPAISNGYLTVQLSTEDGLRKTFYIHILVALAFVYNPDPQIFTDVNHKDKIRCNCIYCNLEWVTKEYNNLHARQSNAESYILTGKGKWGDGETKCGSNNGMSKFTELQVRKILESIEAGSSYKEALINANIEVTQNNLYNVSHIVRGHRWKHISSEYNIPDKIPRSF